MDAEPKIVETMSFLEDNLIIMGPGSYCETTVAAVARLVDAGYRIGLTDPRSHDSQCIAYEIVDASAPLPEGIVACLSSSAAWLTEHCLRVPNLVLLGGSNTDVIKAYPSVLAWADDYLAPRMPRINRSKL